MAELNMDTKVAVKNLCEWDLYFNRAEGSGDVRVPSKGVTRLSRGEIQAQVYNGNKMFTGVDEQGSHAKLYVDDKDTRVLLGFESEDGKETQNVITPERVKKILEYKTQKTFEEKIQDEIKLDSEKLLLIEEAKRSKLKDYDKIKFIEEYTGHKFDKKSKK